MVNELVQHITVEESTSIQWVKSRPHSGRACHLGKQSGSGCSNLTTLLANVSLKFQTSKTEICQYFLSKKCEKLLQGRQKLLSFFQQKISVYLVIKCKTLNELTS